MKFILFQENIKAQLDPAHSAEAARAIRAAEFQEACKAKEEEYDSKLYSPIRIDPTELEFDAVIYNPEDDEAKIEYQVSIAS